MPRPRSFAISASPSEYRREPRRAVTARRRWRGRGRWWRRCPRRFGRRCKAAAIVAGALLCRSRRPGRRHAGIARRRRNLRAFAAAILARGGALEFVTEGPLGLLGSDLDA